MKTATASSAKQQRSSKRPFGLQRKTQNTVDATLRALDREGIMVSSVDDASGELWLGLLHGEDAWCRLGVTVARDHFVVRMRAFSPEESLGYLRWRYEELIDDQVDIGPQRVDDYGLSSCDMERRFTGLFEMVDWLRRTLDVALDGGLEFSARHGFDFSPDSCDMAWHFQCAV
jgi:hypothetical protein